MLEIEVVNYRQTFCFSSCWKKSVGGKKQIRFQVAQYTVHRKIQPPVKQPCSACRRKYFCGCNVLGENKVFVNLPVEQKNKIHVFLFLCDAPQSFVRKSSDSVESIVDKKAGVDYDDHVAKIGIRALRH